MKLLRPFYLIYAYGLFVLGLLIIFPFVLLAIPFGEPRAGNWVIKLCRGWSDAWLFGIGIKRTNINIEPIDANKHYVFVANHSSYIDIPLMFQGIRKNAFRILGKMEMSRIPVFGIVYKVAVVLVDRSSPQNRARSIQHLKKVLDKNISIFIFPEGTFNMGDEPLKSFYDGAFRIAIETQTPIKPIIFADNNRLMHQQSIFSLKPGISRAVILPEISVEGLTMDDVVILKDNVFAKMEAAIIQYQPS